MSLVTVLLPVYNAEKYINEAVFSILNQTYSDFQLIIIDDGSTDQSNEILNRVKDRRILNLRNSYNQGLIYSLNRGLEMIKTKYLVRMDADDISHQDRIKCLVEFMEKNDDVGICGTKVGGFSYGTPRQLKIENDVIARTIHLFNCSITHASAIYRMDIIRKNKITYNEIYKHAEDNAFITDILKYSKGSILNENLYWVRKHEYQVSNLFRSIQKENSCKRRVRLLKEQYEINLDQGEASIYKAISYKESNLIFSQFSYLKSFQIKLLNIRKDKQNQINNKLFSEILYKRIRLIYLRNSHLGLSLYFHYIRNFLFDKSINIGLRLLVRTILRIQL